MGFRKQGFGRAQTQREKLAMIRLCEEMQTMLMKEICRFFTKPQTFL
ncbi:unnamed protein product [Tenebrio molitor]|nr:unnamed protein product [Tenebrio molitor]